MDNQITTQPTVDGKKVSIVTIPYSIHNDTVFLIPEKHMPLLRFFDKGNGKPFQKIGIDDDDRFPFYLLFTGVLLLFSLMIGIAFDSFLIFISFFILVPVILFLTYKKVTVKLSRSVKTVVLRNEETWSHHKVPRDEKIIDFRFRPLIPVSMIEDALRFNDSDVFSLIESFSSISDIDTAVECYSAIENYAEIVRKHDKVIGNDDDRRSQEWITVAAEKARIIADSYDDVFKGGE